MKDGAVIEAATEEELNLIKAADGLAGPGLRTDPARKVSPRIRIFDVPTRVKDQAIIADLRNSKPHREDNSHDRDRAGVGEYHSGVGQDIWSRGSRLGSRWPRETVGWQLVYWAGSSSDMTAAAR